MDVTAAHLTIFDDTDRHQTDAPKPVPEGLLRRCRGSPDFPLSRMSPLSRHRSCGSR